MTDKFGRLTETEFTKMRRKDDLILKVVLATGDLLLQKNNDDKAGIPEAGRKAEVSLPTLADVIELIGKPKLYGYSLTAKSSPEK